MNGGAEIFVGYRFRHLDVYEYRSSDAGDLVVELFWMGDRDDAFGLQSIDRAGECLDFSGAVIDDDKTRLHPVLLYGNGYLRLWSGKRFARLLAYEETDASRKALLHLAGVFDRDRAEPSLPAIVEALPPGRASGSTLDPEKVVFLRSQLVLNSFSSIDPGNALGLNLTTEAVSATYRSAGPEMAGRATELLLVRYPSEEAAENALERYRESPPAGASEEGDGFWRAEEGWIATSRIGRGIAIVRYALNRESAVSMIESSLKLLQAQDPGDRP
jgi:hypothetical protein